MKKRVILIPACLFALYLHAQNVGNVNVSGNLSVGANYSETATAPNNGAIIEGRVGIGTPDPLSDLHLESDGPIITANSTNREAGFRINVIGPDEDRDPLFRVQDAGSSKISVTKGGNFGIGTAVSNYDMEIVGSSRFAVVVDSNTYVKAGNLFSSSDALRLASLGNVEVNIDDNGNSTGKYFRVMNTEAELMRVTDQGRVGVGTSSPTHDLHVMHNSFGSTNTSSGLTIENSSSNNNSWTLYTYNGSGDLGLFFGSTLRGTFDDATGAYSAASDLRSKKNIEIIGDVLPSVLSLSPKKYHYKDSKEPGPKSIGFIAQEVQKLFPEFVHEVGEEETYYTVDYSGFSVVAIKAIQEQQELINTQQTAIEKLAERLEKVEQIIANK